MSNFFCVAMFLLLCCNSLLAITSNDEPVSIHKGICDASGVVDLDNGKFAVADDELNQLLIYKVGKSGEAIYTIEISSFLDAIKYPKKKQNKNGILKQPKINEVDIEGAARIGNIIYWISSHGRTKKGKRATERMRLFATRIVKEDVDLSLAPYGVPYSNLFEDLILNKDYLSLGLETAAEISPKSPGALNIEAITNTPNGEILIGFRSPLVRGKSLIATLLNPNEVIQGKQAKFDKPILLDLDGRGIRGLASSHGEYLVVANDPEGDQHRPALFKWRGGVDQPSLVQNLNFGNFNPEAVAILPNSEGGKVLALSDDGNLNIGHDRCKDISNLRLRRFRSVIFPHPDLKFYSSEH